jgi:thiol:disulfide interchange protein
LFATVVATPCVGPFMGPALAYALVQPPALALLVFATLGLGMALPFLAIGFFPRLGAFLPKPGAWMETFRQVMAFPMYITAVALVWLVGRQTGADGAALVLLGLVLIGFASWLWGRPGAGRGAAVAAIVATGLALGALAHSSLRPSAPHPASVSEQAAGVYSDERLATLREEGRIVFVNFTADWCITCKVNERAALKSEKVRDAFTKRNVVWLTADWTNPDPAITAALARFGRSGVPLYVLYPPRGEPKVLPQILTPDILIDALNTLPL